MEIGQNFLPGISNKTGIGFAGEFALYHVESACRFCSSMYPQSDAFEVSSQSEAPDRGNGGEFIQFSFL